MKIEFLTSMASTSTAYLPGDVGDIPDKQAMRLIARGYARSVQPERATLSLPETAAIDARPQQPRGRAYNRR